MLKAFLFFPPTILWLKVQWGLHSSNKHLIPGPHCLNTPDTRVTLRVENVLVLRNAQISRKTLSLSGPSGWAGPMPPRCSAPVATSDQVTSDWWLQEQCECWDQQQILAVVSLKTTLGQSAAHWAPAATSSLGRLKDNNVRPCFFQLFFFSKGPPFGFFQKF